ncbi:MULTISPECIES: major capsid protein [Pelosinus]|uniref:Prophage LambdaCh01, coat protein n=1 Tax=Pelosinus fermentans B4 TaxID=1149862 RepID=I8RKH6_9FIRM|nr:MULTISPECIES: major capsid protein [Pelosinus]EIW20718.1 prophage LambdaCh01, coat protein [Pelosinus fermentans B4]EIW25437.1 prophage LambdaCh01, coat protein [Pelosinus fermentans A11]OAM93697.1 prophage LambdaCh01, coat protein [Pelosinus fermentans DSM 17108]SDQ86937.1 hypothetical protein SAMN04515679_1800 [Pelosinus fermentans]
MITNKGVNFTFDLQRHSTKIADIIIPEVFNPYVIQRAMELSALVQSGIITNEAALDALVAGGGKTVNMPYFNDLTGADEVLSDTGALTPSKINADQDVAVILMRGKAWSVNDLAKALSGADPMKAIGDLVAVYWARRMQATLISMLKGVFASSSMSGNVKDISALTGGAELIGGTTVIDAFQTLGDAKQQLTGIAMHSNVEAALAKQNLITTVRNSDGEVTMKSYMDKRIIVDDGCPVAAGVYTTYLFGQGAIGLGNGHPPVPTETDRDSLAGEDILINRKHFILHPRGVAFTSNSVAGSSPTNAELETATNWNRKYENKAIKIVKFVHKI